MPSIGLDLGTDMVVTNDKLTVKIAPGSTLTVRDDGLYAPAPDGPNGSDGSDIFPESENEGVRVGYRDPFSGTKSSGRIVGTNIIHRVFDATNSTGQSLIGFRDSVDYVLPGDMFRVANGSLWNYYLVRAVTKPTGDPGNRVSTTTPPVFLGSW